MSAPSAQARAAARTPEDMQALCAERERQEWEDYRGQITAWELDRYLAVL